MNMKKRIVILTSMEDYWEACYVDGKCVEQAHQLGEGRGKLSFIKDTCKKYNATFDDIAEIDACEEDDEKAMNTGAFPQLFSDLLGDYNIDCE